jgi:hypothetical protein
MLLFSNILVISWRSFLLVEENGVPGENCRPVTSNYICEKENCKKECE